MKLHQVKNFTVSIKMQG